MLELYLLREILDIYRIGRLADSIFVDWHKYTGYVCKYFLSFSYVSAALGLLFSVYEYKSLDYVI